MTDSISRREILKSGAAAATFAALNNLGNWDEILHSVQQQGEEVVPWADVPAT